MTPVGENLPEEVLAQCRALREKADRLRAIADSHVTLAETAAAYLRSEAEEIEAAANDLGCPP